MKKILLIIILLPLLIIEAQTPEQQKLVNQVKAVRLTERVSIDAVLSESVWQRPGFTGLVQEEPVQGVKPTQHSEMWVAYDNEAIYFAAKYYDKNPDSIIARLVRRDYIWGDPSDGCVLYFDSFGDKRNGYFFYVSAAGGIADGLIENDVKQPNDLTWDAVWDGAAHIERDGWSIEMKIPFSQLRFKEGENQNWGINVERFISRNAETDMLAYTPRNESGFTSRFPQLVGIEGITPPARYELLPYMTGKAEYIGSDPNDPFNSGKEYSPGFGLDVRAGLGSSLTLNATINPDFGQVEVDPAVVNLTDVESSFEEKRPFFTEGVTIYQFGRGGINNNVSYNWTSPTIFYSRRIGRAPQGGLPYYDYVDAPSGTHILGAVKISGKIGDDWRIGTIHAVTKREFADIEYNNERSSVQIEPLTYYGVLRAQRDFNGGKQGVGVLATFTDRFFNNENIQNFINKDAFVVGADGWSFLSDDGTYVLNGWGAISRVSGNENRMISLQRGSGHYFQRPDATHIDVDSSATSLTGYAGRLMFNKNRGAFMLNAAFGFISPKFESNDLGFNSFSDVMNAHLYTGYRWNTPTSLYQNASVTFGTYASYDFGGNITGNGYNFSGNITFKDLYGANASFAYNPETYNARKTRGGPLTRNPISRSISVNGYTDNRLWYVVYAGGQIRTGEDADGYYYYAGLELKITPTLTVNIDPNLSIDDMRTQWITAYNDLTATDTYKKRYVFAHLKQTTFATDIRVNWIITSKLSFQAYLQPLIASGKYDDFKTLKAPKKYSYLKYGQEGSSLVKTTYETGDITYTIDADGNGPSAPRTLGNPDFNYISLRGSAVLRWEYMPGSTLYLVWTQNREDYTSDGEFRFGHSMDTMFDVRPDNIFMVKISYWL